MWEGPRGGRRGGRSFPHPVSFHSQGGGKLPPPPGCGKSTGAASRLACGPARAACGIACGSGGAACRPACGSARARFCYPPPLSSPFESPPSRMEELRKGNETPPQALHIPSWRLKASRRRRNFSKRAKAEGRKVLPVFELAFPRATFQYPQRGFTTLSREPRRPGQSGALFQERARARSRGS